MEALEYIHGLNVIHRDLKPSNVFLTKTRSTSGRSFSSGGIKSHNNNNNNNKSYPKENIVIGDVKLGDFGLAVDKGRRENKIVVNNLISAQNDTLELVDVERSGHSKCSLPTADTSSKLNTHSSLTGKVGSFYYR